MNDSPNHPSLRDECDKTIHPDVLPVYERLKVAARKEYDSLPLGHDRWIQHRDYAVIDGVRFTCVYDLLKWTNETAHHEQFEYYNYRYHHRKPFAP